MAVKPRNSGTEPDASPGAEHVDGLIHLRVYYRTASDDPDQVEAVGVIPDGYRNYYQEALDNVHDGLPAMVELASLAHLTGIPEMPEPASGVWSRLLKRHMSLPTANATIDESDIAATSALLESLRLRTGRNDRQQLIALIMERISDDRLAAALNSGETLERLADRMAATVPVQGDLDKAVGPFYDTAGLVKWLGVTKQAIAYRVEHKSLLGVRSSDGHWMYPSFQFTTDGASLPRLSEVVNAIDPGKTDAWQTAIWLNHPAPRFDGMTPAEALRTDMAEAVVATARRIKARLDS